MRMHDGPPNISLLIRLPPLHVPLQVNCIRVPVVEEGAPAESCFDIMLESLKDEPASTQCVFSCQMGRGRTTLGMVVACLIKEIQVGLL